MISKATQERLPNGLLFVCDLDGVSPWPWRDLMVQASPSCVAVVTMHEQDGPTEIVIGNSAEVDPGPAPDFSGEIETPHGRVLVTTVEHKRLLEVAVPSKVTSIRIWRNHPRWADKVIIGIDQT